MKHTVRRNLVATLVFVFAVVVCVTLLKTADDPAAGIILGIFFVIVALVIAVNPLSINNQIWDAIGTFRKYTVYTKNQSRYRYVDYYLAAKAIAEELQMQQIELQTPFMLEKLLSQFTNVFQDPAPLKPTPMSWAIGPGTEKFFPNSTFWVCGKSGSPIGVIRIHLQQYGSMPTTLEIAARDETAAQELIEKISEYANQHSIYKGHLIELKFHGELHDYEYNVVSGENFDVHFLDPVGIEADEIVLDDHTLSILNRNVVHFNNHTKELQTLGLPAKRGVLFYGPPGTGKTYTCKFLAGQLKNVTTFIVTGASLVHFKSVCSVAQLLQPSLIILEDVDLAFAQREINAYAMQMGDLMDALDGFGSEDAITFVLTTNELERVEDAIKNRPGRISQCIHFGAPNAELRAKYLKSLLRNYPKCVATMDNMVEHTAGCSQAFIKEFVFRAVQVAFERCAPNSNPQPETIEITDADFDVAIGEMRSGAGGKADSIVGFRTG